MKVDQNCNGFDFWSPFSLKVPLFEVTVFEVNSSFYKNAPVDVKWYSSLEMRYWREKTPSKDNLIQWVLGIWISFTWMPVWLLGSS